MRKSYRSIAAWLLAVFISFTANAQTVTISGTVKNANTKEGVIAVSVTVKGTFLGTYTDPDGQFSIQVPKLPVVLVFSSTGGYEAQELTVTSATQKISIDLKVVSDMGQEVVVTANRVPTTFLKSPVSIERLSSTVLKNAPTPSLYEAMGNLKGVDVHTASLNFRTVTTRGFVSSGNTRLIQLTDGMDNQAPGLNFSVGGVIGLSDLDIDNIELLPGASSALYGSGGMNGTVLISSKNPFKFTGLSYNIKQGIMHADCKQRPASPYYNWSFRWAKNFKNKFAVKLTAEIIKGNDWQADDYRNKRLDQTGLFALASGNRSNTPDFNGINNYGDETSVNLFALSSLLQQNIHLGTFAASGGALNLNAQVPAILGLMGNPAYPSNAQLQFLLSQFPASAQGAVGLYLPFYLANSRNYFGNAAERSVNNVTRTGYEEKHLVDYGNLNAKIVGAFHYKIKDNLEASVSTYIGTGTTVYTGADRYALRNLKIAQHKFEVRSKNWFFRAYTTQENAGESYNASAAGAFVNEAWKTTAPVSSLGLNGIPASWIGQYLMKYSDTIRNSGAANAVVSSFTAHNYARSIADIGRLVPGTPAFDATLKKVRTTPIKNGGALFLDKTDLYASEVQANVSDLANFSDKVEVVAGVQWKRYMLNSQGTLFADHTDSLVGFTKIPYRGYIKVNETGAYVQLRKAFSGDAVTLSGSIRYDKQTNYDGKFTPRVTALVKLAKNNYLRTSFQTAYRFPTMQNQYIALTTGTAVLIGHLPEFQGYYRLNTVPFQGYTAASIVAARAGGGTAALVPAVYRTVKPESVSSYEVGYKGILMKKLVVDAYLYFSRYKDFLATTVVGQARTGVQTDLLSPFSTTNISYVQNAPEIVKAIGWGISIDYNAFKNYFIIGNVFTDRLKDAPVGLVTFFNAPKYRFNLGMRNDNVWKNFGFNVIMKWQDDNYYEGTFVKGTLPSFAWVDGQISYKPAGTKSIFRVGATNIGNSYRRTGFGSPYVGGLYYISYGFNIN